MPAILKSKIVLHGAESRAKILKGADLLADAVKVTLGPKGRNVVIGRRMYGLDPAVTKDGVTVANVVNPTDPCEQIGADLLRAAAQKTVDNAGDGTTTSVVLAQALLHAGFEAIHAGASPVALKREMDRACLAIIDEIRRMAVPATGEMVRQVANISANGDGKLASIVAEAIEKVGKDGVITVEESRTLDTHLEYVAGLQLNSGFLSPYFLTNAETMRCEYESPMILLWEGKLSSARSLVPVLKMIENEGRPLLIVGGDYENEAISVLATNRIRKGLQVCAVTTGAFGDRRRELLRDVAAITGAKAFTEDIGAKVENVQFADLGSARKIQVTEKRTIIVGSESGAEVRAEEVRRQITAASGVEKAHLEMRLAGLTGGVAVIKVGASTEVEMKERKDRAEDAMYAVKAAMEEGVVEGGGMALWGITRRHYRDYSTSALASASSAGECLVYDCCRAPIWRIMQNAGWDNTKGIEAALIGRNGNIGFDAATGTFKDLMVAGIIDPAKVVIEALKNAVSVSGMVITSEALVAEVIEDDGR